MLRVGFDVPKWENKSFEAFTSEELLEYWYKLRLTCKSGVIEEGKDDPNSLSAKYYVIHLQNEILSRMKRE